MECIAPYKKTLIVIIIAIVGSLKCQDGVDVLYRGRWYTGVVKEILDEYTFVHSVPRYKVERIDLLYGMHLKESWYLI